MYKSMQCNNKQVQIYTSKIKRRDVSNINWGVGVEVHLASLL